MRATTIAVDVVSSVFEVAVSDHPGHVRGSGIACAGSASAGSSPSSTRTELTMGCFENDAVTANRL